MPWRTEPEVQQETYKDQAYRLLRKAIIEGEFQPGELLVATRLSEELRISRTPVREALQALHQEGWVERLPTGVVRVSALTMNEIEELYATREVLEGLTARYAARRRTPEHLERLKEVMGAIATATARADEDSIESLGRAFHATIHEASGFRLASQQLSQMRDHINRYRRLTIASPGRTLDAYDEHVEILEALEACDAARAEEAMRTHIQSGWLVTKASFSDRLGNLR